jgi:hypothetical protein
MKTTKIIGIMSLALAGAALAVSTPAAKADVIEVDFSGQISVQDQYDHFGGLFHNGEDYTASFTFDPSSSPLSSVSGPAGSFASYAPPLSFTANVGGYVFQSKTTPPYDPNTPAMYVQDATPGLASDVFLAVGDPVVPDFVNFPDAVYGQMDFFMTDPTGTLFTSTALPSSFPMDQFQFGGGSLVFFSNPENEQAFLTASVQAVTVTQPGGAPEPSTWLMLCSGCLLLMLKRVRRRYSGPNASNTFPGTPPLRG